MAKDKTSSAQIKSLFEQLASSQRRHRQEASHQLEEIARTDPQALSKYVDALIEALSWPEAQTRWEVLSCLASLSAIDAEGVAGALEGAEIALFDEGSAIVRLAAFKFLASYGKLSAEQSSAVWPLLDEAIQCYHGDPEYRDMLVALEGFAHGDISDDSAEALLARLAFDAENGRGYVKTISEQIVAVLKGRDA